MRAMTDTKDFMDLLSRLSPMLGLLERRWTFDADIRSEATLSLWRHFVSGVSEPRQLARLIDIDVRRHVRREMTQRLISARLRSRARFDAIEDDVERLTARLDALRACEAIEVPPGARAWVERVRFDTSTTLTPAERMAGRRWSERARRKLCA
jgi:hypothetical protein